MSRPFAISRSYSAMSVSASVLGVAEHEEMPAVGALRDVDAGLVGDGDQLEVGVRLDVGSVHLGVTRVRRSERVVEPAHQRRRRLHHFVVEHAEQLVLQLVLGDAVMVVDAACAPQQMWKVECTFVADQSMMRASSSQ